MTLAVFDTAHRQAPRDRTIASRAARIALAVIATATLSGCAGADGSAQENTPAPTATASDLTWQEAKAAAQAKEREIASQIPAAEVVAVDQRATGTLFSCSDGGHSWLGNTTVTLTEGTRSDDVVHALESHYAAAGDGFSLRTRRDISDDYELQLIAPDGSENYIVGQFGPPTVMKINSSSACFVLPDGVYPGGDF